MSDKDEKNSSSNDVVFEFRIRFPSGLTHLMERYVGSGLKAVNEIVKLGGSWIDSPNEEPKEIKKIKIK